MGVFDVLQKIRSLLNQNENNASPNFTKDQFKSKYFPDLMLPKMSFGTPSYPSPLDRIRTGRQDRTLQLGLSPSAEDSFEGNQSFPKASKSKVVHDRQLGKKVNLDNFRGKIKDKTAFSKTRVVMIP